MKSRILVLGKNGRLGAALCRGLATQHEVIGLGHKEVDLMRPMPDQLREIDFDLLINTAAATGVDWCEEHPEDAERINVTAVSELGRTCSRRGARMLHLSTGYVFDGFSSRPYQELDLANPINVYGRTKRLGEEKLLEVDENHLVIRVSWLFGPDKTSFIDCILYRAETSGYVDAVEEKFAVPTYTLDLVEWIEPLLFRFPAGGILHLCNAGGCSWRQYAQYGIDIAAQAGVPLKTREVHPASLQSLAGLRARRPDYTVMDTDRFTNLAGMRPRGWQEAVADYVRKKYRS
jgi:dTDP-4-dehydrorhamnose reductase